MDYEWDVAKAAENRRKHGLAFEDAIPALEDPNRIEDVDDRFAYGCVAHADHRHDLRQCSVRRHHPARRGHLPNRFGAEGDPT